VSGIPTYGGPSGPQPPFDPSGGRAARGAEKRGRGLVFLTVVVAFVFVVGFVLAVILSGMLRDNNVARGGAENPEGVTQCEGTLIGRLVKDKVQVRSAPDAASGTVQTFSRVLPYGVPTVFALQESIGSPDGSLWYKTMMPAKPNGVQGFVPKAAVHVSLTNYRLVVDLTKLRLFVYRDCRVVQDYPVAIGKSSTPTPVGHFYLTGLFQSTSDSAYGPYAFSLSAFSNVFSDWPFGGIVGLHGTNDPSTVGHPVTHGCLRVQNADIIELANLIPVGTPIDIQK
jgi:lipoprotein-anchoring transpeptidase ErfK/SrfK